jgi:hypothetical protein
VFGGPGAGGGERGAPNPRGGGSPISTEF